MTTHHTAHIQGLRRSNAAGHHDPRPNRQRTRADVKRAAVRESLGVLR